MTTDTGKPDAQPEPRCPKCCTHGLPYSAEDQKTYGTSSGWCGWCGDVADGYADPIPDDEPQWLCPHGIGDHPAFAKHEQAPTALGFSQDSR